MSGIAELTELLDLLQPQRLQVFAFGFPGEQPEVALVEPVLGSGEPAHRRVELGRRAGGPEEDGDQRIAEDAETGLQRAQHREIEGMFGRRDRLHADNQAH